MAQSGARQGRAAAAVTATATATWWRELVELLKGNFVDDDDGTQ